MIAAEPMASPQTLSEPNPRAARSAPDQPISIYEVHLSSWMRVPEAHNRPLTAFEIAPKLAAHVKRLHFTHVQLHPPYYRDAHEMEFLIESLHRENLPVILESDPTMVLGPGDHQVEGRFLGDEVWFSDHDYKWDKAWAEETTDYFATDPLYRKFRQPQFGHRDVYMFDDDFILPLSDSLVARPRGSLYARMPGDEWQKFANLRLLFAYMFLLPGKKLTFMGNEFGQKNPWLPDTSLDWHLLEGSSYHAKLLHWVANLNRFYGTEPALHQTDSLAAGFQWIDNTDASSSVITFLRRSADGRDTLLAALNFTPVPRQNYRVGVPRGGFWAERLNGDALEFGGSGQGNLGGVEAAPFGWNLQSHSLMLTLPPLAAVVLKLT